MQYVFDMRSSQEGIGGVAEYTRMVARHAALLDRDNTLVLFYAGASVRVDPELASMPNVKTVIYQRPNRLTNAGLRFIGHPLLDAWVAKRVGGVDVWFLPNINFISLSKRQRLVTTIHDVSFLRYPEWYTRKQHMWHAAVDAHSLVQRSNHILAVSHHTKKDVVGDFDLPESSVTVTHLGVNPRYRDFTKTNNNALTDNRRFILAYVGHDPRKNIDAVVKAYALMQERYPALADVQLHIVGRRGEWVGRVTKGLPKTIVSSIVVHHDVDELPIVQLMRRAVLFMYPSLYEGFGLPLLEAMASGVPIITSPNSAIVETVNNGAYYTDPYNVYAMAQAMKDMISNTTLRGRFIKNGQAVASMYTWEDTARKTLTVLEQVARMSETSV